MAHARVRPAAIREYPSPPPGVVWSGATGRVSDCQGCRVAGRQSWRVTIRVALNDGRSRLGALGSGLQGCRLGVTGLGAPVGKLLTAVDSWRRVWASGIAIMAL